MTPPTEDEAIAALKQVQGLTPDQFEKALHAEVGAPMLQVFSALARTLNPGDDDDAIAKKLHLMMLSFLLARSLEGAALGGGPSA